MAVLLHAGYTVLVSDDDGAVRGAGREGVYDFDARLLSRLCYGLDGGALRLVGSNSSAPHRWSARLIAPSPARTPDITGPALPQDALELSIDRAVGRGLIDRITVTNASAAHVRTTLRIEAEPDFADVQEVVGERRQRGSLTCDEATGGTTWLYRATNEGRQFERGVRLRVERPARVEPPAPGGATGAEGSSFEVPIDLPPHGRVELRVVVESLVDGTWRTPDPVAHDRWLARWDATRPVVDGPDSELCRAVERAADDLAALRNDDLFGGDDTSWFPNAGAPIFTGFFGRDTLTAAWQASLLSPAILRGALAIAARTQATADDPWRDAEPGKLVHEIRRGPLSVLDLIPQAAYYGTQTTVAMFVLALSEYWHWTGDARLLASHVRTALRALEWADRYGDLDGDGFLEYQRRSPAGLKNQAWKDSEEAIRYPDGRVVENPIATVEEQAFHCLALERMAEILLALRQRDRATEFLARARTFAERMHQAFWIEAEQFYALALDPAKQQVTTVASNPGHALGAGLVPRQHARAVADRLLAPDLFSGWGVRTLSSNHPSYNPYAYHLGTVWPVEQATFALGFKRYGLDDHVDRLVEGMLAAAAAFPGGRLPELLAGIDRDEFPTPASYPDANVPQAWSASATVQLLQISLGLYPFAPMGVLALVRPRLPASVPEVTLRNVRVGRARVSLRFTRQADGSARHEVVERHGPLLVVPTGPPDAEDGGSWLERAARLALGALPGRRAKAARIALGLEA